MQFPRTKYIDRFLQKFQENPHKVWVITWKKWVWKKTFLHLLASHFESSSLFFTVREGESFENVLWQLDRSKLEEGSIPVIIENQSHEYSIGIVRRWFEAQKKSHLSLIINSDEFYTTGDDTVEEFSLPWISWREYRDALNILPSSEEFIHDSEKRTIVTSAFEKYIYRGSYPVFLEKDTEWEIFDLQKQLYEEKYAFMVSQLYKKDELLFQRFIRILALETGSLLKWDTLAKLVGIPRRKIAEFLDVLSESNIIERISPFVQDTGMETSIHDRFYWSELSTLRVLLGDMYMQGSLREKIIENVLYLELKAMLTDDHLLWFYRKKSQANIPFLLERISNRELIPITYSERTSCTIPQVFQSFHRNYGNMVKRYVIFTHAVIGSLMLEKTEVSFLPSALI